MRLYSFRIMIQIALDGSTRPTLSVIRRHKNTHTHTRPHRSIEVKQWQPFHVDIHISQLQTAIIYTQTPPPSVDERMNIYTETQW